MADRVGGQDPSLPSTPRFSLTTQSLSYRSVWLVSSDSRVLDQQSRPSNSQPAPKSLCALIATPTIGSPDKHINSLSKKYLGEDEYPFRQPGEERVKIVIEPEKVSVGQ